MPKLQHTFVQGKMNKDLDERLVPNGQYRDAQNIQISTSEGSDVGAVENVLGNTKKNLRSTNPDVYWPSGFGLTNAVCIGAVRDSQNEKIYWFITSDEADAIVEYDQATEIVAPVLVDYKLYLNFSIDYLITGVNILEGLLLWTDGLNEPKKLDIELFKAGSGDFSTDTIVYGRTAIESDITVIKQNPRLKPVLTLKDTLKTGTGIGCGVNSISVDFNFTNPVLNFFTVKEPGESVALVYSVAPDWAAGDIIVLNGSKVNDSNFADEYQVRLEVDSVAGVNVVATILSISQSIINETLAWDSVLEEEEPMFQYKFPRFSYRWKYDDGSYSTFAPWSEVAFIGDSFEYNSAQAHNLGMSNNIRSLRVDIPAGTPVNVDTIELLFKESNSTTIYKVDDITPLASTYTVTSEIIGNVIPTNQLLRPWDNVPKTAKAQEVVGNRLLYGNYTQGYDVTSSVDIVASKTITTHSDVGNPLPSVKSMRTYQLGVVFGDEYGRETPVFTSQDASVLVSKADAKASVELGYSISSTAPTFADYFKIYLKETSNEYYNLALDRFYAADDGNVWLSFPSAEVNKVREDGYLILKKEHDTSVPVSEPAKFKILDISNEAPDDVVKERVSVARDLCTIQTVPTTTTVEFNGPTGAENDNFFRAWNEKLYVRFWTVGNVSDYYEVKEGGFTGETTTRYSITIVGKFNEADNFLRDLVNGDDINVQLFKFETTFKKEYQGKFFVKIHRSPAFDEYVINPLLQDTSAYNKLFNSNVLNLTIQDDPNDTFTVPFTEFAWGVYGTSFPSVPLQGSNNFSIVVAAPDLTGTTVGQNWFDNGLTVGKFVKFSNDPLERYYKIQSISFNGPYVRGTDGSDGLIKTITLTEPIQGDTTAWLGTGADKYVFEMFQRSTNWSDILDSNNVILSSANPAIFETEPAEAVDIDIYYQTGEAIPIADFNTGGTLDWFNCYSFGNGVESNRVRDDFNAPTIDKGVSASAPLDEPYNEERKGAGLIFSGLFNSTSGVNNLNQFIIAESITKDLNPVYGTIQKLHTRDTDLTVMMEDKIFRVLANKDALYNADGNTNVTANANVLGQSVPYAGEFGISKNPESFASFGFRAYFTDKARGSVIRLSRDGITEINDKGMSRYFQSNLKAKAGALIGAYDEDAGSYNVSVSADSVAFKEQVNGWVTRLSYLPEWGISLNNEYYTFKNGEIWQHSNEARSNFYGTQYDTTITPIINDAPTSIKNYKTLSYEGQEGWVADIITDQQDGEVKTWKKKEGIFFNYINGLATTWDNNTQSGSLDSAEFSVQGLGTLTVDATDLQSTFEITIPGALNDSLQLNDYIYYKAAINGLIYIIGKVTAISGSVVTVNVQYQVDAPEIGDFVFFAKDSVKNTSGIIGYYAETKMALAGSEKKELFAVNSEVFISSE